jgi:Tfp pilus assembly protein PilE
MKKTILIIFTVIAISALFAFTNSLNKNNNSAAEMAIKKTPTADETWYICTNCCKTKKATAAPWENGCKKGSSDMHNYSFCGKAGDYNYTCRNCDAEVYLKSSTSPSASTCCGTNKGTHTWYHR